MPSELSMKVYNIMAREMGHMGKFIVKKQCVNMKIDSENIKPQHLEPLAEALAGAIVMFTGSDKATRVKQEIRRLAGEPEE